MVAARKLAVPGQQLQETLIVKQFIAALAKVHTARRGRWQFGSDMSQSKTGCLLDFNVEVQLLNTLLFAASNLIED